MPVDQQIQQVLQRLTSAIKQGSKPYLLADHLALARMGPLSLKVMQDNGVTYVDNPATHWVVASFQDRAPAGSGPAQRASQANSLLGELVKMNKVDDKLKKTQEEIAKRIDQRKSQSDPLASEWIDKFRAAWNKEQPMSITGDLDFDGYPDSPASPSPQRYLNSFMSLIDALPADAEVMLLTGSAAIVNNVAKFDDDGHIHTVVVGDAEVSLA